MPRTVRATFNHDTGKASTVTIRLVSDEYGACPRCGAYWGNPIESLNFPNRQKVDNHWKCFNPACTAGYYDPETRRVVEDKLDPAAHAALIAKVTADIDALAARSRWVSRGNEHRMIRTNDPLPDGWHEMTKGN